MGSTVIVSIARPRLNSAGRSGAQAGLFSVAGRQLRMPAWGSRERSTSGVDAGLACGEPGHTDTLGTPRRAQVLGTASVRGVLKRSIDAVFALLLLSAMLPVLLVIAVAIKLDSPGPVFYRARRVGYRGKPLMMLKFRKMHHGARGIPLTTDADERLTHVGKVLARTRLDELPQLWDVLRGRLSIVGPRPEDPAFVALHADAYEHILSVRPGITGFSQLAFAEEHKILEEDDPVADYIARILPQKIGLDILYAGSYRIQTDIAVVCWTLIAMLLRKPVAVHRNTGRMNIRRRPKPATAAELAGSRSRSRRV
jgi:lipopolysaccharide/colanic/teichoic acid biosynthesis glycosyltransferase